MKASRASSALERYTVLDLTRVRAGPTAVRQLADWGANVIMVEMPEWVEGDGGLGGDRDGSDFINLHRNKRSITLNLKEPKGVAVLKRLATKADVLVENFRPDTKHRLGIDYESMAAVNPRLVYASISGFGQFGPYASRPGFDQVAQGMGGMMSITGEPGRGPMRAGIPIADLSSGLFCALGILVALLEREASGRGQWVQTSLLHSQIFMLDFQAARWLVDGEIPKQAGNNHPTTIPTGVFETADGHINLSVVGERMWKTFCEVIDGAPLADDDMYASAASRLKNRDTLNAEIDKRLKSENAAFWIERLNAAGIPSGPIYAVDQVFDDEQVEFLNVVQSVPKAGRAAVRLVAQPITMTRTPSRLVSPPPSRGEHNEEVLGEFGIERVEIDELRKTRVI